MLFNCHIPLNGFKRMADGCLRLYLDVSEIDQPKVLKTILSMDNQALEAEITPIGELEQIKKKRKKAHLMIQEIAEQRGIDVEAMKTTIFEKLFKGRSRIRQLSEPEVNQLMDSIDLAMKQGPKNEK